MGRSGRFGFGSDRDPVSLPAAMGLVWLVLLLLTPLSPRLILGEKFCSVLGGLGLPLLVVGLLILVGVGQALGLGVGYDLAALAALLLLPVAPDAGQLLCEIQRRLFGAHRHLTGEIQLIIQGVDDLERHLVE